MTTTQELIERLRGKPADGVTGCMDRFCYLTGPRTGQVTNGGCRCVPDQPTRAVLMALHKQRAESVDHLERMHKALEEITEFTAAAEDDDPMSHVHGTARRALNGET